MGKPLANPVWVEFTSEWENPGHTNGNFPCMRSSLPDEWAVSSSSEVQGSLLPVGSPVPPLWALE